MKKLLVLFVFLVARSAFPAGCTGTGSCYWVGGTGNANDTTKWATTTGGATTGGLPAATDDCIFNSLSNALAYTFTVNAATTCKNFTTAAPLAGDMTWAGSSTLAVSGNYTLYANLIRTYTGTITLNGTGTFTLTHNGVALSSGMTFNNASGTWILADALTQSSTSAITLTAGFLDLATNNVTITYGGAFTNTGSTSRRLDMGNNTWTCTSASNCLNLAAGTNLTLNPGTSTMESNTSSASAATVGIGTFTVYDINVNSSGIGAFQFNSANVTSTMHNLTVSTKPKTVQFQAGGVNPGATYVMNSLSATGTAGNIITLQSTTANRVFFSKPSGTVNLDYVSISNIIATGGTFWNAGCHSTSAGGNSGWVFCDINPSPNAVGFSSM